MNPDLTEPVDTLHADCREARHEVRALARGFRLDAAEWEPAPLDPTWMPPPTEAVSQLAHRPLTVPPIPHIDPMLSNRDIPYLDELVIPKGWFR